MTSPEEAMGIRQLAAIATITIAGAIYFAGIVVALHFLRADYDPIAMTTSHYAVGPYGFLMSSAFLGMSLASLALTIGLYFGMSPPRRTRFGLGLLAIWGVGVLVAMIFPIDLPGAPQTISGTIHRINGPTIFLGVTAGATLVTLRSRQDEKWRPIYRPALALSLVMLAAFVGTFLSVVAEAGLGGLTQRVFLTALVTWMVLMAVRLRSVAIGADPA